MAEGRDVGGVVWPEAELKVWLDAAPDVRARRRVRGAGRRVRGGGAGRARPSATPRRRSTRPTRSSIDSTDLDLDAVVARIVALAREREP